MYPSRCWPAAVSLSPARSPGCCGDSAVGNRGDGCRAPGNAGGCVRPRSRLGPGRAAMLAIAVHALRRLVSQLRRPTYVALLTGPLDVAVACGARPWRPGRMAPSRFDGNCTAARPHGRRLLQPNTCCITWRRPATNDGADRRLESRESTRRPPPAVAGGASPRRPRRVGRRLVVDADRFRPSPRLREESRPTSVHFTNGIGAADSRPFPRW